MNSQDFGSPSNWMMMAVIAALAIAVLMASKNKARAFGVGLVLLFATLAAWRFAAAPAPPQLDWAYSGVNTYPDPTIIHDQAAQVFDHAADALHSAGDATVAEVPLDHAGDGVAPVEQADLFAHASDHAPALTDPTIQPFLYQYSPQHEIIRNQRLQQEMPGAAVHGQPSSGHWLETYPDGMQIERANNGQRRLVRDSDYDASTPRFGTSPASSSPSSYKRLALFVPLGIVALMLLAGFIVGAIIRARRASNDGQAPRSGWGFAIVGIVTIFMIVMGSAFFGYQSVTVIPGQEMVVTPYPPAGPASVGMTSPATSAGNLFDAQQQAIQQMVDSVNGAHGAAGQQLADAVKAIDHAPIEQLLAQMTAPRIVMSTAVAQPMSAAQKELADAAKKILAATIPGADPFTQGWLINAAKTLAAGEARFSGPDAPLVATAPASAAAAEHINDQIAAVHTAVRDDRLPPAEGAQAIERLTQQAADIAAAAGAGQPRPKPEWLLNPPGFAGEVRRYVVSVGPYVTMRECDDALAKGMREVVIERLKAIVQNETGRSDGELPHAEQLFYADYILREFSPEQYQEHVQASVGEMIKSHALLEFGPKEDELLYDVWKKYNRGKRMENVVNFSALAVLGLAFVFCLLKVDSWTRGYYTKRLFLGVPAAIIGLFFLAMLILDS